ncbi:hypothetical protein ELI49_37300 [Rhizobium ruizarguesonis]|uniref:Uncharacterized protein n=2 Tax=Rhizobium TaxID=379 RepID=A0AAE8TYN5_9HYPH|nr:hypothetical protein [Rhizobium ruizarguesonis]NEH87467.1 hypothetical protein [Rhizobium ruizarguesonis]NEI16443.1 hypothetical protein [Rhizobium ruizarguesonis]NEJ08666.1 hypothetical protein [Rhizobium ruizarguesonis]NEJ17074.1 hypothetical protein [Rhizobium ruizarguesonis]NEJ59502.1 hypothetical protein [Rhizobium ruizarguesonis]
MGEIKHFSKVDFSDPRSIQQIVSAAKADPGFWLMVKEREMERRTLAINTLTTVTSEVGSIAAERLTPSIAVLAEELVSRMFGTCSTATLANTQEALLQAAGAELRDVQLQNPGDSSSSDVDDR